MTGIQIKQVTKNYGKKKILKPIDCELQPGKIYGLLGRNGAGKSTLLSLLANRIFPTSGEILVDDQNAIDNAQALGKIYLMSEKDLYPASQSLEQLMRGTELLYGKFNFQLAYDLAGEFELNLQQKFGKLSTGYRSIFKLITALATPVQYLLLDEPTLGLDANHRDLVYQAIMDDYLKHHRTVVIATHLIDEVANLMEHVLIIDHGDLVLNGETEDILANAHLIVGPAKDVAKYTDGFNIIGQETLGRITGYYVYGPLDDQRILPDTVSIEQTNLQKLFVYLTNNQGGIGK
ncbi:ABC transporter ATP-binding protein [Liquorilactobacillus sicerae]|uniref:ATP-binding cassette domain-containing protein n=1 Tax=Liquorilactobacillus sicerae TaxID=1416943 RepID=UPI002480A26F|nr:ABC transporter ATP-binding protein [Liquorilactobacillus sicerae]